MANVVLTYFFGGGGGDPQGVLLVRFQKLGETIVLRSCRATLGQKTTLATVHEGYGSCKTMQDLLRRVQPRRQFGELKWELPD